MLIVDTSVVVKWFVVEDGHREAIALLEAGDQIACPDFAIAETANVLWRKVRGAEIELPQARQAVAVVHAFFNEIIPSAELSVEAFGLAEILSHSVYDCFFLAAALSKPEGIVITDDRKYAQKCVDAGSGDRLRLLSGEPLVPKASHPQVSEN